MNKFFNIHKHCGASSIYVTQLRERKSKWLGDIVKYLGVLCNALLNLVPFAGQYQESLGYRFYWIRAMKILEAGLLMTSLFLVEARLWLKKLMLRFYRCAWNLHKSTS